MFAAICVDCMHAWCVWLGKDHAGTGKWVHGLILHAMHTHKFAHILAVSVDMWRTFMAETYMYADMSLFCLRAQQPRKRRGTMSSAAKRIKTEADLIAEELTEEMDDITEGTEAMDEAPAASVNDVETGDFDAATASGSDDETHMGMGVSMAVQRLKHESAESAGSDCSPAASGGSLLCGMERASSTEMDVVTRMMGTAAAGEDNMTHVSMTWTSSAVCGH